VKPHSVKIRSGAAGGEAQTGVARALTSDLLGQARLSLPEASQVEAALRSMDWIVVWDLLAMGQARHPTRAADPPSACGIEAGDGTAVASGLLSLVIDLCDALAQFAGRDETMVERMAPIRALLAGRLTPERLTEARNRLASLIEQQLQMQRGLQDTRLSLKDMLSTVLARLRAIGESAGQFGQRVNAYQQDLAGEPGPETLRRVTDSLLVDTRRLADEIDQSREHLAEARRRVESFESRVRDLEHELAQTARLARNDPLTHALNRRGLDEVIRTEAARCARYQVPLTVTMVDLDDFKRINDQMGHAGGDRALVHFVTTAQANLRSTDRIARTGGEEFVLVFPATGIAAALDALRRVQGSLARTSIRDEDQAWVLTFSAGVAQWRDGDTLDRILERADAALYKAKQLGKNRVEIAS
jgi:diguanylate cyclase